MTSACHVDFWKSGAKVLLFAHIKGDKCRQLVAFLSPLSPRTVFSAFLRSHHTILGSRTIRTHPSDAHTIPHAYAFYNTL